jgi:hypothetical protein
VTIEGGSNNPNSNLSGGGNITNRSDSIVMVPVYDGEDLCPGGVCNVGPKDTVGFLQLGITQTEDLPYHFEAVILNAVGCNPGATGTPLSAQNTPVPVRLIRPSTGAPPD